MNYQLFNTDGKTFFDFRSNPNSRNEGFVISFLDDGTVVMSGDYGTLCWKRNYHHEGDKEFNRDYGFPSKETNIGYFAEKVCQFGIKQEIKKFNKELFLKRIEEYYGKEDNWDDFEEAVEFIDENDEFSFHKEANDYFIDAWEISGEEYTDQFKFMFEALKSVSEQVINAVKANAAKI